MRLICISDTHNQHQNLQLPAGDVLIHAGDISVQGSISELAAFFDWFAEQPYKYKVVIAGNHDFLFERQPELARSLIPSQVHYLQDSQIILEDFIIWGAPWTSMSSRWAFHADSGITIARHWQSIPEKVDILLTHAPPAGTVLAELFSGRDVGCARLRERILAVQPKVHIFGHIHEGYGTLRWPINKMVNGHKQVDHIQLVNAAVLDHYYEMTNPPIVIDVVK